LDFRERAATFRFCSAILADLDMRGIAISFLMVAFIELTIPFRGFLRGIDKW
jgi:hypothetical protein